MPALFDGADELICRSLRLSSLKHLSAYRQFAAKAPDEEETQHLVKNLFDIVSCNWETALTQTKLPASRENWRWKTVPNYAAHNRSLEVTFERAVVRACRACDRTDWSNQVPVASGIGGPDANRRRAIDLVHRRGDGAFEFIELKITSDTPLYAAFEIIQYGMIWLLSRRDQSVLGYTDRELIHAADIGLCVLAPKAFYRHGLEALARGLSGGLAQIGAPQGLKLRFRFERFADDFVWPGAYAPEDILRFVETRRN